MKTAITVLKINVSERHHISSLMGTLNVDDYKREFPLKGIVMG